MSRTPAAQLARLKVTYGRWLIYRHDSGGSEIFVADERYAEPARRLIGSTPASLENELIRAEWSL